MKITLKNAKAGTIFTVNLPEGRIGDLAFVLQNNYGRGHLRRKEAQPEVCFFQTALVGGENVPSSSFNEADLEAAACAFFEINKGLEVLNIR